MILTNAKDSGEVAPLQVSQVMTLAASLSLLLCGRATRFRTRYKMLRMMWFWVWSDAVSRKVTWANFWVPLCGECWRWRHWPRAPPAGGMNESLRSSCICLCWLWTFFNLRQKWFTLFYLMVHIKNTSCNYVLAIVCCCFFQLFLCPFTFHFNTHRCQVSGGATQARILMNLSYLHTAVLLYLCYSCLCIFSAF